MIPLYVQQSKILDEFTPEEQKQWFDLNYKAVRQHVDTLYYTVSVLGDCNDTEHEGMLAFLSDLAEAKERKCANPPDDVLMFGLSVEMTGAHGYDYQLRLNENFDIFIARYLPNTETPRFVVQLRSHALVMEGALETVLNSFAVISCICDTYGFSVNAVKENRFDYAFHTNLIQNPMKYFSDGKLLKHLRSSMRSYAKYGTIGEELTLETLSLGNRKSNNIFFRCYDKTREVVEKGYKAFFIVIWQQAGIISAYDAFVLNVAYSMKSYRTGLLVGRIDWYLQHGKDEAIKSELRALRKSCFENSDNAAEIEKKLAGILPTTTTVVNVEFQTKRKFYVTCDRTIDGYKPENVPDERLKRICSILELRPVFLEYLTSPKCVAFVVDRKAKDSPPLDWWRRIQSCKPEGASDVELLRSYERHAEIERAKRSFLGDVANCAIIQSGNTNTETTFKEDISDVLCILNDNDLCGGYNAIRRRKQRQKRGVIKRMKNMNGKKEENENENENE